MFYELNRILMLVILVCVCVCIQYVDMYLFVCVCIHMCVSVYTHMCGYVYACMCAGVCIHMCGCVYTCMCAGMCAGVYILACVCTLMCAGIYILVCVHMWRPPKNSWCCFSGEVNFFFLLGQGLSLTWNCPQASLGSWWGTGVHLSGTLQHAGYKCARPRSTLLTWFPGGQTQALY